MENLPVNVALVYDRVNKWGGAESVLLALHELFPTAPLFTSVYDASRASWARVFPQVIPSFLQSLPWAKNHHELIPFLSPLAFESLDLRSFGLVISVTSADAKGIITQPGTFHVCYCLTPTRYLWSHQALYTQKLGRIGCLVSRPVFAYLKFWDRIAATRPDSYIAISQTVKDRVKRYYHRDSQVVYPPVDIARFSSYNPSKIYAKNTSHLQSKNYYLYVSRLVSYKRPEVVIQAFNQLNRPLIVVGTGNINWGTGALTGHLRRTAHPNITFTGFVSPNRLENLYRHCKALVFFHEEDFGIVAAEAQAAGKPVIGINRGGVAEIVIDGQTGLLSSDDTVMGLVKTIQAFEKLEFNEKMIRSNARRFSKQQFKKQFIKALVREWTTFNHISTS